MAAGPGAQEPGWPFFSLRQPVAEAESFHLKPLVTGDSDSHMTLAAGFPLPLRGEGQGEG